MIPEFKVQRYNMQKAREDYAKQNSMFETLLKPYNNSQLIADILSSEPEDFKEWFGKNKTNYLLDKPRIYKIKYDTSKNPEEQSLEARNNMLIDISYSILTHPETAYKFLSAGNFNKVKKAAKIKTILNDSSLLETYMLENNLTLENVGEHLLNNNEEVLGKFVKKYIKLPSPLSLESFVYFHKQNTTGGKLIGMYANNTSLQAKFQGSDLSVFSDYIFNMNGRPLNSLHDITSGLGELISKNCAEFSAASVDDVKDPNLAQLDQRPDTANITATMLRLGMSIEEIGLMFSHPYVKMYLNRPSYERSLDASEFRMLAGNKIDLSKINITSKDMINAILEVNTSENPYEVLENGKYTHISSAMLQIMDNINIISKALSTINKSNRVDSTNNAIDISFSGAVVQRFDVDNIHLAARQFKYPIIGVSSTISNRYVTPNMSKEELRKKFNSHKFPMLQAFYSLGIEFADELVSNYFIQTTPYVKDFLTKLRIDADSLSSQTINSLYKDFIYFGLTNTELFGDSSEMSMKDKKDYYLNQFPNKFKQVIRNNPDIASLGVIKKMTVENDIITFNKSARMTKLKREFFSRDFDSLLYSDNPEAVQLAYDLFMYAFYKEHLDFGPNNYGYFFSSWFLSSFPEYIEAMRTMQFEMQEGSYFDRFKLQYYYQNPHIFKDAPKGEFSGNDYIVEAKKARNPKVSGVGYYEYLNYSSPFGPSYLLVLDRSRSNNEVAIYTIQDTLKKGVFNAKSDVVTLIEENSTSDNQVAAPPVSTAPQTVDIENIPLEDFDLLEGDVETPNIDMDEAPDNLYEALSYFENLDLYNEADGEALLDNPLCDYL